MQRIASAACSVSNSVGDLFDAGVERADREAYMWVGLVDLKRVAGRHAYAHRSERDRCPLFIANRNPL